MSDQAPAAGGASDNTTPAETAAPSTGGSDLAARLAKLEAENNKLRDESAQRRIKAKEEGEKAAKALEEQGQFKALAETLKARLAELEPLEGDAKQWRSFVQQESQRIDAQKASLPPHWQAALDGAGSLDGKRAVLAAYEAERGTKKQPAAPPPGGAAPAPAGADFAALASDPAALRQAKQADPAGWSRFVAGLVGRGRSSTTTLGARAQAQAANKRA